MAIFAQSFIIAQSWVKVLYRQTLFTRGAGKALVMVVFTVVHYKLDIRVSKSLEALHTSHCVELTETRLAVDVPFVLANAFP